MASEMVKRVLEAEADARGVVDAAYIEAERIVARAEADAAELIRLQTEKARRRAEEILSKARLKASEHMSAKERAAQADALALRAAAADRMEAAAKSVADFLIGGRNA